MATTQQNVPAAAPTGKWVPPHLRAGFTGQGATMPATFGQFKGASVLKAAGFEPAGGRPDATDWFVMNNGGYPHVHFHRTHGTETMKFIVVSYGLQHVGKSAKSLAQDGQLSPTYQQARADIVSTWGEAQAKHVDDVIMYFGIKLG